MLRITFPARGWPAGCLSVGSACQGHFLASPQGSVSPQATGMGPHFHLLGLWLLGTKVLV